MTWDGMRADFWSFMINLSLKRQQRLRNNGNKIPPGPMTYRSLHAPLVRREETSSHSICRLHCSLDNGVSIGECVSGGGSQNLREWPWLTTSRTNCSRVIRCQAGRDFLCYFELWNPRQAQKVDLPPPPADIEWNGRSWWGRTINGARLEASYWRFPVPLALSWAWTWDWVGVPPDLLLPLFYTGDV